MTQNQAIMASLPMLASILANKYGVSVEIGSKDRACTDGKTIYLPTLPVTSTETFITLVRGFLDHEAAHCRFTDYSAISKARNKVEKYILNALEDYQIEHKMSALYAGCGYNFHKLILEVFGKEVVFDFSYPSLDILNWLVLRLRAWDAPELETRVQAYEREISTNFSPAIIQMILPILQEFRDRVDSLTTEDCLVYARKIADMLKNPQKHIPPDSDNSTKKNNPPPNNADNKESANKSDNGFDDNKAGQEENNEAEKNCTQSDNEGGEKADNHSETGTTTQDTKSESKQEQAASEQPYSGDTFSELFDRHTQLPDNFDDALSKAIYNAKEESLRLGGDANVPIGIAVEAPVGTFPSLDTKTLTAVERTTSALKVRLFGLMQAKSWSVTAPAHQGKLNTSALHKVVTCDDKVFLQRSEKQKLDTAVHILLDRSGSMSNDITTASAACHTILTAMQAIGVNVGYTMYPLGLGEDRSFQMSDYAICVRPIVKHGGKVRKDGYAIDAYGDTPTGSALMYAIKTLLSLKEKRKCIFLITDGMPNNPPTAKAAVQTAESLGIEVYGVGLSVSAIYDIIKQSVVIQNIQELPNKLFRLMSKILLTK